MRQLNVLVVEDDPHLSHLYQKILSHAGYNTLSVNTIADAIVHLYSFNPDIVCLDWQLSETTCEPFLTQLQQHSSAQLPQIVLVSGKFREAQVEIYRDFIHDMLLKPVGLYDITRSVNRLTEQAAKREPLYLCTREQLAPGVAKLTWVGIVSQGVIRDQLVVEECDSHILLDLSQLKLNGFESEDLELQSHPCMPTVERVYTVFPTNEKNWAQTLLECLPDEVDVQYFSSLDEALEALNL